ncbi:two pore calcium channel protein 1-like [Oscarella lobularis]|uniref:two pore calcium channel protein 1-like n=1 Tax=Oscarella lobularis TaxID=121494 RepID=UPI0033143458
MEPSTKYQALLDEKESISRDLDANDDQEDAADQPPPPSLTMEERFLHAARYLREGQGNLDFNKHPKDSNALAAASIVDGIFLNAVDLMASICLMALALFESPAVWPLPITAYCCLEIFFLLCLLVHSIFYYRWRGTKMLKEPHLIIKHLLILEMLIESLVIVSRQETHIRFMRLFRPYFLITNRYSKGMKRVIREMIQSLPPVLDVMILLLMFITIFSVFGYYLFGHNAYLKDQYTGDLRNWYFEDLNSSWVNLFILLTTANFPDMMMPAYKQSQFAALFFVFFLLFGLYFVGNLLLAAVCNNFNKKEKKKFGSLYQRQLRGLRLAFEILDKDNENKMTWETFEGLLTIYRRRRSYEHVVITFHALDVDGNGYLTLKEFSKLFSVLNCSWHSDDSLSQGLLCGFDRYPRSWKVHLERLRKFVSSKYFEYFIDVCIAVNSVFILTEAALKSQRRNRDVIKGYEEAFLVLYSVEAALKITSLGFRRYIKSGFNKFDFAIVVFGIIGTGIEVELAFVTILRPFRLLRLLRLRKSFLHILASMFNLLPKMIRFLSTLICFYYIFAIIGMESFEGLISKCGCVRLGAASSPQCYPELFTNNGTWVRLYGQPNFTCPLSDFPPPLARPTDDFTYCECTDGVGCAVLQCGRYYGSYYDRSTADGLYYMNNFDNLINSYVTLFELMIINNWHVTMQGTVDAVHIFRPHLYADIVRIFFILFYMVTVVVVINVVVAFILGAFESLLPVMKRKYRSSEMNTFQDDPTQTIQEIEKDQYEEKMSGKKLKKTKSFDEYTGEYRFIGRRAITQLDVYLALFEDQITQWEAEEAKSADERKPNAKAWFLTPRIVVDADNRDNNGDMEMEPYQPPPSNPVEEEEEDHV